MKIYKSARSGKKFYKVTKEEWIKMGQELGFLKTAACMEHECHHCHYFWMNNKRENSCPKCGSFQVSNNFDEECDRESSGGQKIKTSKNYYELKTAQMTGPRGPASPENPQSDDLGESEDSYYDWQSQADENFVPQEPEDIQQEEFQRALDATEGLTTPDGSRLEKPGMYFLIFDGGHAMHTKLRGPFPNEEQAKMQMEGDALFGDLKGKDVYGVIYNLYNYTAGGWSIEDGEPIPLEGTKSQIGENGEPISTKGTIPQI